MFQIDERSIADNRALISIQQDKNEINTLNKNGTINFTSTDNELWLTIPKIRDAFLKKDPHIIEYFDKLLIARRGLTIEGSYEFRDDQKFLSNLEVGKNVVIRGNLSVLGESTTVDTPNMTIEDNIIELNKNEKSEGLTLRKAGTALNRGTKGFARYLFSEDHGGFIFDNASEIDGNIDNWSLISLTENNGNFKAGDLRVKTTLHAVDGKFSNNLNVGNEATIKNLTVNNSFNVTGTSTFNGDVVTNGTLTTNGQVNFKNNVTAYKPVTFQDITTFNANVIMNKLLTNNGLVTMNQGLNIHNSNLNIDTGTLHVGGAVNFDNTLHVIGNTNLDAALQVNSNITSNALITGNEILSNNNFGVTMGNGKGYKFWNSQEHKMYMNETANSEGGYVEHANLSDYNIYFKITGGTNRGFVFKNGNSPIAQIEGSGILRSINDMYSKGSRVLTKADEGEGNHLDADTVDGKHARDLLWRDGSLPMLGNLQMGSHRISFADNNDYLDFNDTANINGIDRGGLFRFVSDNDVLKSIVEAGVLKAGQVNIDNSNASINGLNYIYGSGKQAFLLNDDYSWLRINPNNDYTSGVYLSQSIVRTDNEMQIGPNGETLKANKNEFLYKNQKVLTQAGIDIMNGDINMGAQKISFNINTNTGRNGAAASDSACIYAEHNENTEVSRLVLDISDNIDDAIVIRTSNMAEPKKDSFKVDYNKAVFSDNPYFGSNRILHAGDMGSGHNLDADTVDGKHYSDLVNDFVNVAGDSMSGTLAMRAQNKITFGDKNNEIRGGGNSNASLVIAAKDMLFLRSKSTGGEGYHQLLLDTNGRFSLNNIEIVNKSMYGHGKGLDADTIDGQHLTDLDNRFVNTSGDMMTGDLKMSNGTRFIGAYNYGYMCFDSSGNPDYIAYIDDSNRVHLGYNNRQMILDYDNPVVRGEHKIWHAGNHGHNSGLDADKIDGLHLTDLDNRFVNSDGDNMSGPLNIRTTNGRNPLTISALSGGAYISFYNAYNGNTDERSGWIGYSNNDSNDIGIYNKKGNIILITENNAVAKVNNNKILTTADNGHGKGLDADTLDGRHGSDFADVNHNHNKQYVAKDEIDLENKYRILYDNSTNSLNFMYLG